MPCHRCNKVAEILAAEAELIKQHLTAHKLYNHIAKSEDAIADFIDKYAWIMREVFCATMCNMRDSCPILPVFPEFLPDVTDKELQNSIKSCESDPDLTEIELLIVKKHIRDHKWFKRIPTYHEAIEDFLCRYGWIIRELKYSDPIKNILKEMEDGQN